MLASGRSAMQQPFKSKIKEDTVVLPRGQWVEMTAHSRTLHLKMGRSTTAGLGLFSTQHIAAGMLVVEYIGTVRSSQCLTKMRDCC